MSNLCSLYSKAIEAIRERREQTLAAWDQFIEAFDPDGPEPRITRLSFEVRPPDRRDACIAAYDEAIAYLSAGGPNARAHARAALVRAAELEDEAGMVLRARSAIKNL